jgi:uncharacterized protein (TIGR01777 family)
MKKVIITGGSGFIGQNIAATLLKKNYEVLIFDLRPPKFGKFIKIDLMNKNLSSALFEKADSIIHLAGINIFGRWNQRKKKLIYESRVLGTRNLVSILKKLTQPPTNFISASAVGIYGNKDDEELNEETLPGKDFLAQVCVDWEQEAELAKSLGIRTTQIRTAPVLGLGGLLQKLLPIYKMGLGGSIGSGKQWFPWIHIYDIVQIYIFAMEKNQIQGPLNACSPKYITNQDFSNTLALVLEKPAFFRTPKWILKLILNDLADSIVVSQKVSPQKLIDAGYVFSFPNLQKALTQILKEPKN